VREVREESYRNRQRSTAPTLNGLTKKSLRWFSRIVTSGKSKGKPGGNSCQNSSLQFSTKSLQEIQKEIQKNTTAYKNVYIDVDGKPEVTFKCLKRLVGERGFEPPTPWSRRGVPRFDGLHQEDDSKQMPRFPGAVTMAV